MSAPGLVATKFDVPQTRDKRVSRPRLLDALHGARNAKLVLVAAPAGSGKTTLLAD